MPEEKKQKGKPGIVTAGGEADAVNDNIGDVSKSRPDVTQKGQDMIGDFRTDALYEALGRAPIEDDMLMALLVLAFAGLNVRVDSGASEQMIGPGRFKRHAARLIGEDGKLAFDQDTLRVAARSMLIDVLSCRRGMSNSGIVSRIAGDAIGADSFLPNMGTEDFLLCLSRQAMEAVAKEASVTPRQKVRETRAALVKAFEEGHLVHPAARFAPEHQDVVALLKAGEDRNTGEESADTNEADGDGTDIADDVDDRAADLDEDDIDADVLLDEGEEGEDEVLTPLVDDDDLPDAPGDDPAATDHDDDQNAYGIAAE